LPGVIEYNGTPMLLPRDVISRASASSPARRLPSFCAITTATTFWPWPLSGVASGAFQVETKLVDVQAVSASATPKTTAARTFV
jgi:hypothetical protein